MTASIPTKYRLRVKQRLAVVTFAAEYGVKPTSRHFGLNRDTVRQWRERWLRGGVEGLVPRYPPRRRRRKLDERTIALIKQARTEGMSRRLLKLSGGSVDGAYYATFSSAMTSPS